MALDPRTFEQIRLQVRRFVSERLVPNEDRVEREDAVPDELVVEMKELGLFGLSIPEEYGGLGLSMSEECDIAMELGQTVAAFRSVFGTNVGIGSQGILMDGTAEQKRLWLPRIASGEAIFSFALTEPDAGSDAAALRTTAIRDGDSYVLNGTKRYITNAPRAHGFTVMARTDPATSGAGGISAFIVPRETAGLRIGPPDRKMGQKGTLTCDVVFEEARVPSSLLIGGEPGRGFKTAMKVLDRGRLHIAAVAAGTARRLLDEALQYARTRRQFGQAIVDFQLVQAMLADSQSELLAGEAMVRDAARRYDVMGVNPDPRMPMVAAACKYFVTEMVGRVADRAVQIHGGAGYMSEYKVERFYRDVRLLRLYEGTSQILQLVIAKGLKAHGPASTFV
jgi:acyl-CoA dehydrogenase